MRAGSSPPESGWHATCLTPGVLLAYLIVSCAQGFADPSRELGEAVAETTRHATEVHQPTTLGVVDTSVKDIHGTAVGVACVTCHGPDPASSWAAREGAIFHTGVELQHGSITCASCHDPDDRTQLRLADGTKLPFSETMTLCAQCHGPQFRDYSHGSHGGMTGYWDTRRGPRDRNHCVDCHAPHTPQYAKVMPVFPPADRKPLESAHSDATTHEADTPPAAEE